MQTPWGLSSQEGQAVPPAGDRGGWRECRVQRCVFGAEETAQAAQSLRYTHELSIPSPAHIGQARGYNCGSGTEWCGAHRQILGGHSPASLSQWVSSKLNEDPISEHEVEVEEDTSISLWPPHHVCAHTTYTHATYTHTTDTRYIHIHPTDTHYTHFIHIH